jgi:hypothetical protein
LLRAASFRLRLTVSVYPFISTGTSFVGGAEEIRTPDLRRAKAALSQLSYGPIIAVTAIIVTGGPWWTRTTDLGLIRTAL